MGCKKFSLGIFFLALVSSFSANAESKITGFASFAAGMVQHGDAFLADYPNTGVYDNDLSFSPDSTIGIQLKTDIADQYNFVVQVVSNAASGGDMEVEWAYLSYQYTPELSFQMGRKHLPLYYYSDVYDVGYAYNWIRPPSDNYTWQILNYNGVSLNYEPILGAFDSLFSVYFGREDSENNRLLTYLANGLPVNETWKNIFGVVAEISNGNFEARIAMMSSELDREINSITTAQNVDQVFSGLSLNYYYQAWSVLSEFNRYRRSEDDVDVSTTMLSLAYKVGAFTPHLTYSELTQQVIPGKGDEHHHTTSLGLRWDIEKNVAIKFQYDITKDLGTNTTILGDGELLSFAIDLVF